MDFQPVQRRRLYQEVADRIERVIRDGHLAEGESLPSERELVDQFAVGRPAIREALLTLQQKGLILVGNGEPARVARPDADQLIGALSGAAQVYLLKDDGVRHFQAARKLFEAAIARQVACSADSADIAHMEASLAANHAARGDAKAFEATDVAFHLEIVRAAGNPLLIGLHQALSRWLTEQRTVSLTARDAETAAIGAHCRIFAAIKAHDPDTAEAEMQSHLDEVAAFYWRRAKASGGRAQRYKEGNDDADTLDQGKPEARRTRVRRDDS